MRRMQMHKVIRHGLIAMTLLLLSGVVALGQSDQSADEWARTQMTSTVAGGTGLFNTFSPRTLHKGELTFGLFYNNVKRDPGALDINQIPANLTIGLGGRFEGFINMNFFQQVTSRQPFLLSGPAFSFPRLLGLPTEAFFGPPLGGFTGQAAPFFPGSFAPRGGILPALSSPLSPGPFLVKVPLPGYNNDYPFAPGLRSIDPNNPANDQFQNSSNRAGNISFGLKYRIIDPDRGRYGMALIGIISIPTAENFSALSKGAGTGERDYGLTLAMSQEYYGHRLRLMENLGYLRKGDPSRNDVKLIDLKDEVTVGGGISMALTHHIETVTELTGTFYVGGATPNFNPVNPVDYQTGVRFHFMQSKVSFGGAFRVNLTRADLHSNIPGLIFAPTINGGSYVPTIFNFASEGVSSFVAFLSIGTRKFEAPVVAAAPVVNQAPTVNCSAAPDSVTKGSGNGIVSITSQARDPENDIITYSWSASGGATVNGTGANVTVDTNGLSAGSYTVTETVSDGHGNSASCSSTFTVRDKPNNCPSVSVSVDPRTVEAGTNTRVTFHATASDPDGDSLTYQWSSSSGSVSGSGDTVTLDTSGMSGGSVRVTVTVSDGKCQQNDSATLTINSRPVAPQFTQLSSCNTYKTNNDTRPDNTCKGFLDDAAARLQQDPRAILVVQGFSQAKEKANVAQQRAERVRDYLVGKGIDAGRIKVVAKGNSPAPGAAADNNKVVAIFIVPEGASEPQ